jgi:hypothetical protein
MRREVWIDKDNIWGVSMRFSSGLTEPCSDERGSPKKSPDYTLLLKIIDILFHTLV